jgi:fucose 4-O-acetylase-like acetyltransferase
MSKSRLEYFDIYRGFGILLMVMGHIGFGNAFSHYIHGFHMPLFFLVSGFFTNPEKDKNFLPFICRISRTILVPYLVFATICQPLHYIYTHKYNLRYFLLSLATSNHNRIDVAGAYWFLLCLFTCKILFWGVLKLPKLWMRALIVIILTFAGMLKIKQLPLCLDSAMSMIDVMYVGYILKLFKDEKWMLKEKCIPWWGWLMACISGGAIVMMNGGVNIRCNHYSNIWLFLIGCLLTLFGYLGLARRLAKMQNNVIQCIMKILKYFGRNSIVYLVLNELVIHAAYLVMYYCGLFKLDDMINARNFCVCGSQLVLTILGLALATEFFNRTIFKVMIGKNINGFSIIQ